MEKSISKPRSGAVTPGQIVVALAGVFYTLTALALLFAPVWFFQHIGTYGLYNRHYEGDLGAFLLALGLALLVAARDPARHRLLVWAAALGSLFHALNHLYDSLLVLAWPGDWLMTTIPLLVFSLLLVWVALRARV
ncbi:MAG TPA: hypothetical protein VH540_12130 [Ktedonobacterales bacterium]|jgi:hypothetical protein